jgi:hypothetical protein
LPDGVEELDEGGGGLLGVALNVAAAILENTRINFVSSVNFYEFFLFWGWWGCDYCR